MSTLVRLSVVAVLVVLAFATTSGSPGSMSISFDTAGVQAQSPTEWCNPYSPFYNANTCAQYGGSQCVTNPAACAGYNQNSMYCQAGAYYNPQLCQQYGGQTGNYYQLYCIPGTATYSQVLCSSYGGSTQTSYQQYCTPGTVTYNIALCQQYGGQYNQYSQYCTPGTASYNIALCQQYGGQNQYSQYCTPGTASYNIALCQQYGGQNQYSQYCTPGTASYNIALCQQYGGQNQSSICVTQPAICTPQYCAQNPSVCAGYVQQNTTPAQVLVNAASTSVSCNGTMTLIIAVATAANQPVTDGTAVSLSTSAGSVTPSSGTTQGGTLTALFSGGTVPTTATVTATAGGISGTKGITINCSATTPSTTSPSTTAPPSSAPVYTSPPPPPASGGNVFSPPNTGDGGLLALLRDE